MGKKIYKKKSRQAELGGLLKTVQEQLPGVTELVKAYGNYEETVLLVQQYLEMTQPQPVIATSNQSGSTN